MGRDGLVARDRYVWELGWAEIVARDRYVWELGWAEMD